MRVHPVGCYKTNRALAAYPHCGFIIHTEASNTDFRWTDNHRSVLHHDTCGHPSRTHAFSRALRPLGSCRPPFQPSATFTAPFCTRSDPGEDDFWEHPFFRSSVSPLLSRRTVPMMQSADLWDCDDLSQGRRLNLATHRNIASQPSMRPVLVVVVLVSEQGSPKVLFVQHDDVIRALTPDRADDPFAVRILPRRPGSDEHLLDAHVLDAVPEVPAVDRITISNQITRSVPFAGNASTICCSAHSAVG